MLAVKVLQEQGVEVVGLSFKSYFFNTESARKAARQLGIELMEIDFSDEHLAMVKNPKYGYGKNINPCIDCHAMMFRKAGEFLKNKIVIPGLTRNPEIVSVVRATTILDPAPDQVRGDKAAGITKVANKNMPKNIFDFIATGEVLGQRPKSQNKEALDIVAKYSGVDDLLVRPLSAKLLNKTKPEKDGRLIRGKLLDIKGRTRQRQVELARKYGIKEYPSSAGGCILTDLEFSQRLMKLFEYWPECDGNDVELIKNGRVLWINAERCGINPSASSGRARNDAEKLRGIECGKDASTSSAQARKVMAVIGRNKEECENLEKLAKKGDIVVELKEEVGPLTIVRIFNFQFSIFNEKEIILDIPKELKMSELRLGEEKSEKEILRIVGLLTGYYAPKARGKKIKLLITNY